MLLSVQAGFDPRDPLAIEQDRAIFQQRLERNFKGTRVAWAGDFKGYTPYEPGVLDVCRDALKVFESLGCVVEEAQPDYPLDAVWRAVLRIRSWQQGGALLAFYNDAAKRALATAKPGTPEFRVALKNALFSTKDLVGTHAVFSFKPGESYGVDERSLVLVRLVGGQWKYQP